MAARPLSDLRAPASIMISWRGRTRSGYVTLWSVSPKARLGIKKPLLNPAHLAQKRPFGVRHRLDREAHRRDKGHFGEFGLGLHFGK